MFQPHLSRAHVFTKQERDEEARQAIAYAFNAPIVEGLKGVCCMCQSGHPVVVVPPTPQEDDEFFDALKDDAENYMMAPHSIYADIYADPNIRKENPHLLMCEGVGTMPQAVYQPKR